MTLVPNSCEGFPAAEEKAFRAAIEHRREKAFPPATRRTRVIFLKRPSCILNLVHILIWFHTYFDEANISRHWVGKTTWGG